MKDFLRSLNLRSTLYGLTVLCLLFTGNVHGQSIVVVGSGGGSVAGGGVVGSAAQICYEGATDDGFETCDVIIDPTADRIFTRPNADSVAIQPSTAVAGQFMTGVSALGVISRAAPVIGDFTDFCPSAPIDGQYLRYESSTTCFVNQDADAVSHNLLSAAHSDALVGTVVRGDLIAGNATPAWARLAKGTANQVLGMASAGTDPTWETATGTGSPVRGTSPTLVTPALGTPASGVVTNLTGTLTNIAYDAEGTGNVLTVTRRLWFPFAACQNATASLIWDSPTTNAAAAACITGTNTQKGVADFDATTDESLQMTYLLPTTFTGAIDARIVWLAAATTGSVGWCVQFAPVADAETGDPAFIAQGAGNCVSDATKGTTLQYNVASITGVTATGVAAGEVLHIAVSRDANGGAVTDDMTGDARGIGLELTIREAL